MKNQENNDASPSAENEAVQTFGRKVPRLKTGKDGENHRVSKPGSPPDSDTKSSAASPASPPDSAPADIQASDGSLAPEDSGSSKTPAPQPESRSPEPTADNREPSPKAAREGDSGLDRKRPDASIYKPGPDDSRPESDSDTREVHLSDPSDIIRSVELKPFGLFARSKPFVMAMLFIAALILLYIGSHTIRIVHDIATLPAPAMWAAIVFAAVVVGFLLYSLARAAMFFSRLSKRPQIDLEQLRSPGYYDTKGQYEKARNQFLVPFVEDLRDLSGEDRAQFAALAGGEGIFDSAERLAIKDRAITNREWIDEFLDNIQEPLVAAAEERVTHYAKWVALKTAISPWPLVDVAAVLYNSSLMVTDLAIIFNRRFTRPDTVRIMLHLFFAIYISGQAQQAVESVAGAMTGAPDHASDAAVGAAEADLASDGSFLEDLHSGAANILGGTMNALKGVGSKVVEGLVNALIVRRLGHRVIEMLKPVA